MILIFSEPIDWRDLQNKVCLLLSQSGFEAEIEKVISTPRGEVEIDVFAVDPRSIDKITYVVECKNWCVPVNQSVIHAFTTVMSETGSNIGYIVSKVGFQNGAVRYTNHTNIKLFSFTELQDHYYKSWMINYFAPQLENYVERCNLYVEPCNCTRDRAVTGLNEANKNIYNVIIRKKNSYFTEDPEVLAKSHGQMNCIVKYTRSFCYLPFGVGFKDSIDKTIINGIFKINTLQGGKNLTNFTMQAFYWVTFHIYSIIYNYYSKISLLNNLSN